jgi:hypothetical protein
LVSNSAEPRWRPEIFHLGVWDRSLVGDHKSFPWVSEIFPSCPLTGVWFFFSLISLSCTFSGVWFYFSLNILVLFTFHRAFSRKIVFRWWS